MVEPKDQPLAPLVPQFAADVAYPLPQVLAVHLPHLELPEQPDSANVQPLEPDVPQLSTDWYEVEYPDGQVEATQESPDFV